MAKTAFSHALLCPIQHTQPLHLFPGVLVQGMQEIKINEVHIQARQLFIQQAVKIRGFLNFPAGHLGGQADLIPVAILQHLANKALALPLMVGVSRIHIVDPLVNGTAHHRHRQRLIDLAAVLIQNRQPHGPKTQGGYLPIQRTEFSILHC